jgi:1,4-dihydroxy-2-naphthoyl-CoA hydrolase
MTTVHDPAELVASMPFAVHAGVTITRADRDAVTGHLEWAPERCTVGGLLHGGALMTLADSLGAVAAFLHLPEGAGTATIGSSTTLLRGVRDGRVHGTATVLHAGRRTITVRTDLHDDGGRAVATTTQTQAVLT